MATAPDFNAMLTELKRKAENRLKYNPPDEETQLFVLQSPSRPNFVNRILSKAERRVQYRVLRHLDDSKEKELTALNRAVAKDSTQSQ